MPYCSNIFIVEIVHDESHYKKRQKILIIIIIISRNTRSACQVPSHHRTDVDGLVFDAFHSLTHSLNAFIYLFLFFSLCTTCHWSGWVWSGLDWSGVCVCMCTFDLSDSDRVRWHLRSFSISMLNCQTNCGRCHSICNSDTMTGRNANAHSIQHMHTKTTTRFNRRQKLNVYTTQDRVAEFIVGSRKRKQKKKCQKARRRSELPYIWERFFLFLSFVFFLPDKV